MIQASKIQPVCGFRHFLHHWELEISELYPDGRTPQFILKMISASSCLSLKVYPCNYATTISDPNQSLFNMHPDFLPALIIILDKQLDTYCNFVIFASISLPHFAVQVEHNSSASEHISQATVLSLAWIKLYYIPIIDCLLIISVVIMACAHLLTSSLLWAWQPLLASCS